MSDRSPFRALCDAFDTDTAIKTAKRLGIPVTDEEIKAAREKDQKTQEAWNGLFEGVIKRDDAE